jgi:hypothetical protein
LVFSIGVHHDNEIILYAGADIGQSEGDCLLVTQVAGQTQNINLLNIVENFMPLNLVVWYLYGTIVYSNDLYARLLKVLGTKIDFFYEPVERAPVVVNGYQDYNECIRHMTPSRRSISLFYLLGLIHLPPVMSDITMHAIAIHEKAV